MKLHYVASALLMASCAPDSRMAKPVWNFDALYQTASGKQVKYVRDADIIQRWNVLRPIEPDEKFRTLEFEDIGPFISIKDFILIPHDPESGVKWQFRGITCRKIAKSIINGRSEYTIKCNNDNVEGYILLFYSKRRGVLRLEEHCASCGDDEVEVLISERGLGAQVKEI